MKKLNNTEAELKKSAAYIKNRYLNISENSHENLFFSTN